MEEELFFLQQELSRNRALASLTTEPVIIADYEHNVQLIMSIIDFITEHLNG